MNNMKKIGLSALAGSMVLTSANAVDYGMSGGATIAFSSVDAPSQGEATNGKGIGVATDLTFSASGELDNGYTVSFVQVIDTNGALSNTSSQVAIGMGSLGSFHINNKSGSMANGIDDVMPAAYNETWDGLALTGDNPSFFGSGTASGSVDYRIPAMEMMGLTINAGATLDGAAGEGPASKGGTTTTSQSGTALTVKIAHESGLEIGGGQEKIDNGTTAGGDEENVTAYAKYSMGPVSVGIQEAYQNSGAGAADNEADFWAIAYTAGNVSVSYGESTLTDHAIATTAAVEREMESVQISYTAGAMTIAAAMAETANAGGVAGQTYEENELSVSFAF